MMETIEMETDVQQTAYWKWDSLANLLRLEEYPVRMFAAQPVVTDILSLVSNAMMETR